MSTPADVPNINSWTPPRPPPPKKQQPSGVRKVISLPSQWIHQYDDFITKNAHQVSQIESALRSLTYIIPGRFRDAEIASESIHSGVQLLSLYHDTLLRNALSLSKLGPSLPASLPSSDLHTPRSRYTRFWTAKSALYRRVAYVLQIVNYIELLCEMAAKRRGEKSRWRVVILLEAIKAFCRLLLLRITRSRPIVSPCLPERPPIPDEPTSEEDQEAELKALMEEEDDAIDGAGANGQANGNGHALVGHGQNNKEERGPNGEWIMPRTGMALPSLPAPGDISGYLLSRVLTADDIKPATKLMNQLQGSAQFAEVLHILAPLIYAVALARSRSGGTYPNGTKRKASWTPWVIGLAVELAARQLRDRGLRTTPLEREEWSRRGWAMGWWTMRGAFYENVTKGLVEGVRRRVPSLIGGILEDYEYLWENYYFSTAA